MAKSVNEMSIEELVAGESAAATVRRYLEDKMVMYRGVDYNTLQGKEREEYGELSQKLSRVNAARIEILAEMERRLLGEE